MNQRFIYDKDVVRIFFHPFLELIPESIYGISPSTDSSAENYVGDLTITLIKDNSFVFGTIPDKRQIFFSTKIIDLIWITAYATGVMYHDVCINQDTNIADAKLDISQPNLKIAVDMLDAVYKSIADKSELIWSNQWPTPELHSNNKDIYLANELMLGAMAFIFHHEIVHIKQGPGKQCKKREREADMNAANWIFQERENFSLQAREKQGLSIVSALIVLNICGIRLEWWGGFTHPFVYDRLRIILDHFFTDDPNSRVWSFPSVVIATTLALTKNEKYLFAPPNRDIDHRDYLKGQIKKLKQMANRGKKLLMTVFALLGAVVLVLIFILFG